MAEKNNKYYVFYDESEAAGLAGTKTTIKWDYERVIILRSGTVDCRQEFAGGLVSESMYRTPYLALPMRLTTDYLYGYGTSWSYNFDMHEYNPILMDIASVHDDELTGETRNIVVVDFFDKGEATKEDEFVARKREFSILPDASGDGTDALQYSGSFGVKSEPVKGYAKVAADGKSCTFLEKPTVG